MTANRLWLRFLPIAMIVVINVLFWLGWVGQSAWFSVLVMAFGLHVILQFRFFRLRREIFMANKLERDRLEREQNAPPE